MKSSLNEYIRSVRGPRGSTPSRLLLGIAMLRVIIINVETQSGKNILKQ